MSRNWPSSGFTHGPMRRHTPVSNERHRILDKALAAMKNLLHWLRTDHPLVFICCVVLPGSLLVLGLLALFGVL